jgi:ribosomal protein S18 acetylase RimI-like enzyme
MKMNRCWSRQPLRADRRSRSRLRVVPLLLIAVCLCGPLGGGRNTYDVVNGFFHTHVSMRRSIFNSRPKMKRILPPTVSSRDNLCPSHRLVQQQYSNLKKNHHIGSTSLLLSQQQYHQSFRSIERRRTVVACSSISLNLFFRSKSEGKTKSSYRRRPLTSPTLDVLQSPNITLPLLVQFDNNDENNDDDDENTTTNEQLILRCMVPDDLRTLVPMCIEEFGAGPTLALNQIPWYDLTKIPVWWDRFYFERMISLALRAKMAPNQYSFSSSGTTSNRKGMVEDPAMLVLCRRKRRQRKTDQEGYNEEDDSQKQQQQRNYQQSFDDDERVVGMVELSLQPPEFDKNPPAFPIPRWIKEGYSDAKNLGPLQGWVTNLLIAPTCRGIGYSKILMRATEGIARGWGCKYIYLHADADIRSGRVPQRLYESLGYEVVSGGTGNDDFTWAGLDRLSAIRMVDGAALLCYSKCLAPPVEEAHENNQNRQSAKR